MVFNTKKLNKYRGKIAFIRALFLREIGVALGIGSTWKYLGIAYKDPKKRNTLKNLYANTDDVAGGLYWSSNFGMTHGVVELDKTTRQMPLPKPIPRCCGYAQDVMKVREKEDERTLGLQVSSEKVFGDFGVCLEGPVIPSEEALGGVGEDEEKKH